MNADYAVLLNVDSAERNIAPDNKTVVAVQEGSPASFAELYALYSRRLYKKILAITRCREDAEDALQETFLRAYSALHTFEGRSNIYSWLTRIAINSALMILRRRRARPEMLFDPQPACQADALGFEIKDSAPDPEQVYDLHQRQVRVLREIHTLSPKLREPIRMQLAESVSIKQLSQALNISEAAVKSRLSRARQRLSTPAFHVILSSARSHRDELSKPNNHVALSVASTTNQGMQRAVPQARSRRSHS